MGKQWKHQRQQNPTARKAERQKRNSSVLAATEGPARSRKKIASEPAGGVYEGRHPPRWNTARVR